MNNQFTGTILITVTLAVGCFSLASYVMNESKIALYGYKDCRGFDGFSMEDKCAEGKVLGKVESLEFMSRAMDYVGLTLLNVSIFLPALTYWRKRKSEKIEYT
jgi:hypothetical protein